MTVTFRSLTFLRVSEPTVSLSFLPPAGVQSMSILIVDDNPINLKILEYNLNKRQYETIITTTGKEALKHLNASPGIQLVITDIVMPEMNGLELLREMKKKPELKEIPVIICSSKQDKKTVKKAARLGCDHYMAKPVNIKSLLKKISKITKAEIPVIGDKNKIRLRLSLNYQKYKQLDASFYTMVLDKISLIENEQKKGFPEDISDSILELSKGAKLLGAERLTMALKRLKKKKMSKDRDAIKNEFPRTLREMKSLRGSLLTKPVVTIRYELPEDARVTLTVAKVRGSQVRCLVDEDKKSGEYEMSWDGTGEKGERLSQGLYEIHLKAGSNIQNRVFRLE